MRLVREIQARGTIDGDIDRTELVEAVRAVRVEAVVATSDEPPLVRRRAVFTAQRIAEHFADEGADVLLAEAAFCEGDDNPADLHLTGRVTLVMPAGNHRQSQTHARLTVPHKGQQDCSWLRMEGHRDDFRVDPGLARCLTPF